MTKSVFYSEQLDKLALRPIGRTKLTYIEELLMIEGAKPDHQKDTEKTNLLLQWKHDEERLVKMAVDKDTSIAPTEDLA